MAKLETDSAQAPGNQVLKKCAVSAQETDQRANEAEVEAHRLKTEFKQARKAYRQAKKNAKQVAKDAEEARAKLSACLEDAFRDLALALKHEKTVSAGKQPNEPLAANVGLAQEGGDMKSEVETRSSEAA